MYTAHEGRSVGDANTPVPPIPTVLIADDDPGVVQALSARCKRLGFNVVAANDGLQAILKTKTHRPDLLIVDINMPEFDGFKVCEWVLDPKRQGTDIIVLTGMAEEDVLERCGMIGAHYVPKSSQTWETIRALLSDRFGLEPEQTLRGRDISIAPRAILPIPGPRVLIVDDDPDVVRALEHRLRKLGATTFTAEDAIDAYRIATREQPHIVIADYVMPRGGGHYLLWRMRENSATRGTPVFIITGQDDLPDLAILQAAEFNGGPVRLFRKPLDTEELVAAMRIDCRLVELQEAPVVS